ncbi:MAG TPA: 4Fe-4S dicluster domain-containing protein [Ignavibacteriales bacterium]|nr:4Fe-4S dicluster domain-containing protein [Ignavibacteriales bacterium]
MELAEKLLNAGVVGAGGAGFPTHVKAKSQVEFVLANGAECEPLLHKDVELMINFAPEIVRGMQLMMDSTAARLGYFGIKSKNIHAIEAVQAAIHDHPIEICELGDFYPSGDEYELVYSATKRLIPPAGIPLNVGCVVNNVESLYNVSRAMDGIPVTEKILTVTGAVRNPSTFFAPIGTSFEDLIKFAGGTTVRDYCIFISGIMMGGYTYDASEVVTKTTSGIIILPKDHFLVKRKDRTDKSKYRIGKSACDQCSYCTEFCPRYLLGYNVQPHKVMRSLVFSETGTQVWNQFAELCCSCGICTLYACPEDLYPREACEWSKIEMRKEGFKYTQTHPVQVHPVKEGRRVPVKQLIKRLNLQDYNLPTPFIREGLKTESVKILLKQHTGEKSVPVVDSGASVKKGQIIARPPEGKLGANLHASIDGVVTNIAEDFIRIIAK